MPDVTPTCPHCGARLADGADVCDLCGTSVSAQPEDALGEAGAAPPVSAETPPPADAPAPPPAEAPVSGAPGSTETPAPAPTRSGAPGVFCNQCGWQNPPGARFCSMCGSRLQAVAEAPPPAAPTPAAAVSATPAPAAPPARVLPAPAPPSEPPPSASAETPQAVTRQVGVIVGAGVLLVIVLFLVTAVSKEQVRPAAPTQPAPAAAPALSAQDLPPLPDEIAGQVAALEDEIDALRGEARLDRQRALVSVLFNAGRLDRAAIIQQEIAGASQLAEDWKRTGDLFYDWMNVQDGPQRGPAAQQAIDAYQRVLAADPENLDVRTDMATAYLSTNNPMQGVQEIRKVLDADSTHLHARFNYGIMLSMIGRAEKAVEQFEFVKTLVDETSPLYRQADEAIRAVQSAGASSS